MFDRPVAGVVASVGWLPLFARADRARSVRRGRHPHAYIGPNGGGKSLACAYDVLPTLAGVPWYCDKPDHYHTSEGVTSGWRRVLSTMRFTTGAGVDHPLWTPLDDWAALVRAEHVDLVLDEVAGVASSRSSHALPPAVETKVQELRRADVALRTTAPSWKRADTVLREISQGVTLCQGYAPLRRDDSVRFLGPHLLVPMPADDESAVSLAADYLAAGLNVWCPIDGPHSHDVHRQWAERRLFLWRTYDATVFDEWTLEKRRRLRPLVRQLFWRPGSDAERAYDTLAYVEKLAQVTEAGTCIDCGGRRKTRYCECEQPSVRRRRALALAAKASP